MKVKSESEVAQSCLTLRNPWTVAYQAPPSMGFPRQEYWLISVPLKNWKLTWENVVTLFKDEVDVVQSLSHVRLFATP